MSFSGGHLAFLQAGHRHTQSSGDRGPWRLKSAMVVGGLVVGSRNNKLVCVCASKVSHPPSPKEQQYIHYGGP